MIVEKKIFHLPNFTTFGGKGLKDVRVGWESYGTLNAAKDNAILICHYFSGNSHAAGRYQESDELAGYWDGLIGPGKALDTDRFFVLSVDSLCNASAKSPTVVTTGPISLNPETGKPYGLSFPVVTLRDFVNIQRALCDDLGIEQLHTVMGASMGGMQALEWAVTYPDQVGRMVHVIGSAQTDSWLCSWLDLWGQAIRLDPNWNGGDYYDGPGPVDGLALAQKLIWMQAWHPSGFNTMFPMAWAEEGHDPLMALEHGFAPPAQLETLCRLITQVMDANHILYLVRANQLYVAGHDGDLRKAVSQVTAPMLLLPSSNDMLLPPALTDLLHETAQDLGHDVTCHPIHGPHGHQNGLDYLSNYAEVIRDFVMR